jgi:hypothetical protein
VARPSLRPPTTSEVTPPVSIEAVHGQLTDLGAVPELHIRNMHVILSLLYDLHGLPYAINDQSQETAGGVFESSTISEIQCLQALRACILSRAYAPLAPRVLCCNFSKSSYHYEGVHPGVTERDVYARSRYSAPLPVDVSCFLSTSFQVNLV